MSNFTAKEVKRAIRDFESNLQDIMNVDFRTYETRIKSFVTMINENAVIKSIVSPLLEIDIDFDKVHQENGSGWITLNLPANKDQQIAYVLKVFILSTQNKLSLDDLALYIYANKSYQVNIEKYLYNIARPALRELMYRLQDLIVDEVDGKEEVKPSMLHIINHGTITAKQGNIAMGQNIKQNLTNNSIAEEIIKKVKEEKIVDEDKVSEVESLAKEVEEEINSAEPSRSKLKELVGKVLAIGERGLLKTFTSVVENPLWAQAVTDQIFG